MSSPQVVFLTPVSIKIGFKNIHESVQNVEFIQRVEFIEPVVYKPFVPPPLAFLTAIYFVFFLWARVRKCFLMFPLGNKRKPLIKTFYPLK